MPPSSEPTNNKYKLQRQRHGYQPTNRLKLQFNATIKLPKLTYQIQIQIQRQITKTNGYQPAEAAVQCHQQANLPITKTKTNNKEKDKL